MVHQVLKQKDRDTAWADRPALAPPSPRPAHHPPTDKIIEYNRIISVFNYPTQLITAIVRMYGAESTALWNIYRLRKYVFTNSENINTAEYTTYNKIKASLHTTHNDIERYSFLILRQYYCCYVASFRFFRA